MSIIRFAAMASLFALAACDVRVNDSSSAATSNSAATQAPKQSPEEAAKAKMRDTARQEHPDLRFLVDVSDRKLQLFHGDRVVAEHPVAVGTKKWPTPIGSWNLHQVDINPEWNPPKDEEWAEEREPKAPGAPDNPMGRARLVYRMPNTIHGTNDLASLGKAASHGSIRVANDVVVKLAETLLRAGGAWDGPEWFQGMLQNSKKEFQVKLPHPIPIKVQE